MWSKSGLFFILFSFSKTVFAQPGFMHFTVKNGLSQNAITCIYKDKRGFIWLGTQDGLNQFDGQKIKQYRYEVGDTSTISDQYITSINEDGAGYLWVGTRNGLNRLNLQTNQFTRIHFDKNRKNQIQYAFNNILSIGSGNLLFPVEDKAYILNWKNQQISELPSSFKLNSNFTVYGKSVWQYSNKIIYQINPVNGLITDSTKINSGNPKSVRLFTDKNGLIWLIDEKDENNPSISFFDIKQKKWFPSPFVWNEKINDIVFDDNNVAWIAGQSGVYTSEKGQVKKTFKGRGFPEILNQPNSVLSIYPDNQGLIWMGFANNGVLLYNSTSQAFDLVLPTKTNETVYSYLENLNGDEWIAAVSGLYKRDRVSKKFKLILKEKVRSLEADSYGTIWAAIENKGLYSIQKNGIIKLVASVENGKLLSNSIFHLKYDNSKKRLFISTKFGLVIADFINNTWNNSHAGHNNTKGLLCGSYILHSFIDSKGNAWISSNGGLDVLNNDLQLIYKYHSGTDTSSFIKRTIITGCTEDRNGQIWISTLSNGVYKWGINKFQQYNIKSGLSSNVVSGVIADADNKIWIATTTGMNVLNQETNRITTLNEQNGLPATDFLLGSLQMSNKNDLLACSSEGLVLIHPKKLMLNPKKLYTYINNPSINYRLVKVQQAYRLSSEDKSISFELTTPCFINMDKIIYQYKLKGFDEKWNSLNSNDRRINYTNLPFTPLELELRSAENVDLLSSAPITRIHIFREPPFWRKWYFVSAISILFGLFIYWVIRWVTKRKINIEKRKSEIEQTLYKERERISRELHDNLSSYAAAIKSNIIQLEKNEALPFDSFNQLKENAEEMVNALRETIWVLQYEQVSITAFSDRFKSLINRIAPNYPSIRIELKEHIQKEKVLSPAVSIHLLRIMQEALTNSLKHSNCSIIEISIDVNEKMEICLKDNGIGFDTSNSSIGYGLQNIRERAMESGLHLNIQSSINGGTSVVIND
ncbi:MAG: two-component regulator propeller domain-containing protein [Sediminibacterium sp.]|nr:two-component regulator propeller domain-containing protein [Sediminibacterium sp.]